MPLLQVTPEERSLAAAMRWQDELTSRGCLPAPDKTHGPLLSLAHFDPGQLTLLKRSDSKLLSAAATTAAAAVQARANVPTSSLPLTEQAMEQDPAQADGQPEQGDATCLDQSGTPLKITQTGQASSRTAEHTLQAPSSHSASSMHQSPGKLPGDGSETRFRQADPDSPQLARLPSAKGHCLMSYPSNRPQSPMKHPSTPGELFNGLQASRMLSVRPFSMPSQRPSSAAAPVFDASSTQPVAGSVACAETSAALGGRDTVAKAEEGHPVVLERGSQQSAIRHQSVPQADSQLVPAAGSAQKSCRDAESLGRSLTICARLTSVTCH